MTGIHTAAAPLCIMMSKALLNWNKRLFLNQMKVAHVSAETVRACHALG